MKRQYLILIFIFVNTLILFSQWSQQYYNNQTYFYSVFMVNTNNGYVVGTNTSETQGKIYRTTNGGEIWTNIHGTGNALYSVWFPTKDIGIAVGSYGSIIKTTDGGEFWFGVESGTNRSLKALYFIDSNTGWAVGGHNINGVVILKTTDQGDTWIEQSCEEIGNLRDLCFINNQVGWAVGNQQINDPPSPTTDRPIIVKTTDGGDTWLSLNSGINGCLLRTVYFKNDNIGWAAGAKNYNYPNDPNVVILKTSDGGNNWDSQINYKLGVINSLRMSGENNGWAVGYGNVWDNQYGLNYETTDGGDTWIHRTEFDEIKLNSLFFLNSSLGWGTAIYKIYCYDNPSSIFEQGFYEYVYSLSQNYPNPFNPITTIEYTISEKSLVRLSVFDILGREVKVLVYEEKGRGSYKIEFNAAGLNSGIYYYRLSVGNNVETKKMILLN